MEYKDPIYPDITWTLLEGPVRDEYGDEYFTFTGSDGSEGEGYIKSPGIVEIVNTEYHGD